MEKESFIGEWFLPDISVCSSIIDFFESSSNTQPGKIISPLTNKSVVDESTKDSIDLEVSCEILQEKLFQKYLEQLGLVLNEYKEKYPWCDAYSPWAITECPVVQKYKPNAGFFKFHTERTSANPPSSARHLVFMTYLNKIFDGGETEFPNQNIKVKPETGKTLIWPADWTHTHRGIPAPTEEKYILTGWFSYV